MNRMLKFQVLLTSLIFFIPKNAIGQITIIDYTFYEVLMSHSITKVDSLINVTSNNKTIYLGALLVKKAELLKDPQRKLFYYKEGRNILENEINKDPSNPEFRFIRLIIQENAPTFLKYNKNLNEDCILINEHYKKTTLSLQKIIKDYSKNSKIFQLHE